MQDKLYAGIPTASLLHTASPQPLAYLLSRYVIEEFPADLRACVLGTKTLTDMVRKQQVLLALECERVQRIADEQQAREAQLDLVMLLGGYLLEKDTALVVAPPLLLELLQQNAVRHGLPSRMTYDLIVNVNTEAFLRTGGHIRVFSNGPEARTERDFYIGHFFAEQHIRSAYDMLQDIVNNPARPHKAERLRLIIEGIRQFTQYMAAYARLSPVDYAYFRRFLAPYPDGVKNASGAFMPTPQLFEMLLTVPGHMQQAYLSMNAAYFSTAANKEFSDVQARAKAGHTIEGMLDRGVLQLTAKEAELLAEAVERFIQFKLVHIKVVSSKIPHAFPKRPLLEREELRHFQPAESATRDAAGKQQGTGGFVPQDFLGDGIRRLLDLQQRLGLPGKEPKTGQ